MPQAVIETSMSLILNFSGGITKKVTDPKLIKQVKDAIKSKKSDNQILELIDPAFKIKKHSSGLFDVQNGEVIIEGDKVPESLNKKILQFVDEKLPVEPLVAFFKKCQANPDPDVKAHLYDFLVHNELPIMSNGNFVGYRSVKRLADGKLVDFHTGTFDNSVGKVVELDRSQVTVDKTIACASGLHCGSFEYTKSFGADDCRVIIEIEVDPLNVMSIPEAYSLSKIRLCKFKVLAINKEQLKTALYEDDDFDLDKNDTCEEDYSGKHKEWLDFDADDILPKQPLPKRDSKGRFIKS